MPDWIDTPSDVLVLLTIAGSILGALLWLIRAQAALAREFRPNGGSSTTDALNRIEADQHAIRAALDAHIKWHLDGIESPKRRRK
jgi:hypothetical protein